ncbi:hypothetical protein HHK36_006799 [Tetracentron sinense]|uniref:Protein kinase domain-containing protein n=1 Tax=Tetracentron sinense TaxID=13715 RepID=A0A834ZI54_TETSI|nr:hypothetical protein HHK36_006799 [Tetracentron sinense]
MRAMNFSLLRSATDDFSALSLIKIGHSGEFFAGILNGGEKIVVKKGVNENLEKELELYISLSDRRCLVPLLGYCDEEKERLFLVYQFMKQGDLSTLLARKDRSVPWIVRLKIAVEVSEALLFLHCICTPPILHNDIKSSSIMIGENYEVRLGSLSKATKVGQECLLSSDIWHFGMLLMDLISGLDVSGAEDPYAKIWLQKALTCTDRAGLLRLIDPSLILEEDLVQETIGVTNLAKACLNGSDWLTMKIIRQALEQPIHIGETGENGLSSSQGK